MKEQFQKLENLKPDIQAKLRLMERIEEKEMHKNKYRYIWKSAIVIVLLLGLFSIPFVQKNIGNEIEVKAKEVERLNKKIETKNIQYQNGEIDYQTYQKKVMPFVEKREEIIVQIKDQDKDYTIKLTSTINASGDEINITINDVQE